jgi:PhzF family phenazine biosynthesis protein
MDFPADPPTAASTPPTMSDALGGAEVRTFGTGRQDAVVELGDAAAVRAMVPDLGALAALGTRAVIVTASGDRLSVDCVTRVFAPNVGIPEDPVTGSAHCLLAVFWGDRLGKDKLVGEQASARGGTVRMRRAGDRVILAGQAVTVSEVRLLC